MTLPLPHKQLRLSSHKVLVKKRQKQQKMFIENAAAFHLVVLYL